MKQILIKLNKIRQEIDVQKEGSRYKAFTISKLNAELNPLLDKYKLGVTFNIKSVELKPIDRSDRNPLFTIMGVITYTIVDLESEDKLDIDTAFSGLNSEGDPSKSQGSAHSYSYKYLWVTLLGLTDEETDIDSPINQAKAASKPAMPANHYEPSPTKSLAIKTLKKPNSGIPINEVPF